MDDRAEFEAAVKALGEKWDISLQRAMSCGIEQDGYSYGVAQFGYLIWQAATARQRERDAQIADSFCGELTPEQWPPHGLAAEKNRCGDSAETARRLAEAIRRQP